MADKVRFTDYVGMDETLASKASTEHSPVVCLGFPHWHPHYEIQIIYSVGKYTLMYNSRIITSDRPCVYIHHPYTLHMIHLEDASPYSRSIVRLQPQAAIKLEHEIDGISCLLRAGFACIYPDENEMDELRYLAESIEIYSRTWLGVQDFLTADLYTALLLRRLSVIMREGRGEYLPDGNMLVQDALGMMAERLSDPGTAESLARELGVSATKFHTDFRYATGTTYKKYLTNMRQTRAKELLKEGSSIINASLETGYSSEAHFIKAFREYWGMTPGEFIKKR